MADLAARVEALEAEVRALKDRAEIQELRFRYHVAVNEKRLEAITDLFTSDGGIDFGDLGRAVGHEQIDAFFARTLSDPASFVKQFIHNHVVEVDGDRATGLSYLEARTIYQGESILVAARYDDEYVREGGRWKFRKMSLVPIFIVPLREGWAGERIKI
jgi:ketosteroid isomerase-like protein